MLKDRELFFERIVLLGQIALLLLAFYVSHFLSTLYASSPQPFSKDHQWALFLVGAIYPFVLYHFRQDRLFRFASWQKHLGDTLKVVVFGYILVTFVANLIGIPVFHRFVHLAFPLVAFVFLLGFQLLFHRFLGLLRKKGWNKQNIIVVADEQSVAQIELLKNELSWGYHIVGICTNSKQVQLRYKNEFRILQRKESLESYIDKNIVDEVLYCCQDNKLTEIRDLVKICAEVGVYLRVRSDFLSIKGLSYDMIKMRDTSFINYYNTPERDYTLHLKRLVDILFSAGVLLCLLPFYAVIGLLIKMDDGGKIFFSQPRVGRNGRIFQVLKFRTMVANAEEIRKKLEAQNEQEGPVFKMENDPRVTKVGRFLRKTSLDELPQFINVLLGDMSVVGPRPPLPKEVEEYERWQRRRLSVKPGITCIWQVSGRNDIPFERWMELDLEYIDTWSLTGDFKLILKTVGVVFKSDGK